MEEQIIYTIPPTTKQWTGQIAAILEGGQEVAVFGCGVFARDIFPIYQQMGVKIACILDNNKALHGTCYDGIEICPVEQAVARGLPVVICTERFYMQAQAQLEQLGVQSILPFYFFLLKQGQLMQADLVRWPYLIAEAIVHMEMERVRAEKPNALIFKSFELVVTERCTLRCRDCANLMQFYEFPQDEPLEIQLLAVARLLQACDFVGQIVLLGGEPLINRKLGSCMEQLQKLDGYGMLHIYSNGTILPPPDICEQLHSGRVYLSVSNYGAVSRQLHALREKAREEDLPVNFLKVSDYWYPFGEIKSYHETLEKQMQKFQSCTVRMCPSLKGGKLYACPFAAHGERLRAIPSEAVHAIDCTDEFLTIEQLREQLAVFAARTYEQACDYCPGFGPHKGFVMAAQQLEQPRPYIQLEKPEGVSCQKLQ